MSDNLSARNARGFLGAVILAGLVVCIVVSGLHQWTPWGWLPADEVIFLDGFATAASLAAMAWWCIDG